MAATRRSVLAVAVLSMLGEEPMHAYRMQQLVKERHKDDVINVSQRNSIYQTVERLRQAGLVEVESTERTDNRPERTTYRLTTDGRSRLREWLEAMLAEPGNEYPEFPAALSLMPSITPAQATAALVGRVERLTVRAQQLEDEMALASSFLPRLFLIETELQQQLVATELSYIRALVTDLQAAKLTW